MTEEKYIEAKKAYIENIKSFMIEEGSLFPHITVFGTHKKEPETNAIIHVPIPDAFMADEEKKDEFMKEVMPKIAKKINETFIADGVAFAAECWIRTASKEQQIPVDWKQLPIQKEVLLISIETENKQEAIMYDIVRLGKVVTSDGKLVDQINLEKQDMLAPESFGGRMTGLFKLFKADC